MAKYSLFILFELPSFWVPSLCLKCTYGFVARLGFAIQWWDVCINCLFVQIVTEQSNHICLKLLVQFNLCKKTWLLWNKRKLSMVVCRNLRSDYLFYFLAKTARIWCLILNQMIRLSQNVKLDWKLEKDTGFFAAAVSESFAVSGQHGIGAGGNAASWLWMLRRGQRCTGPTWSQPQHPLFCM